MIPISLPELGVLARILTGYAPRDTIERTAGLLSAPELQANTIRLELLVHLAVAHCAGKKKPSYEDLGRWLNDYLGQAEILSLEDPVEDVFVTNVGTPEGNRRGFEGIWESNDYFLQVVLDTLLNSNVPEECKKLLHPAFALLRLSDCVAERLNLRRWHSEPSTARDTLRIAPETRVNTRAISVTFSARDLQELGINRENLTSFIFREEDKKHLTTESIGHSSLERRPLVDFGDVLILALPHAVSPAIRRFVLSELQQMGYLQAFADALGAHQARQAEEGLSELKNDKESLLPPSPETGPIPSFHQWLLKYDINKYVHVVLLHDHLEWLNEQGFSSFMEYPEEMRLGLEKHLNKVAKHCQAQPDYAEGMSLLVMGGLGRGFSLTFNEWPEGWRFSVLRVSDLLMLAGEISQPIKRYLKCLKQREWAEVAGVHFQNINGDFNFYCYWRQLDFQLVPRELSIGDGSMIAIWHDNVFPVHKELRNLVDRHVIQTMSGSFAQVMRFGRDTYFKSMQNRPIYASLSHLHSGVLAGVVETSRGPTWLVIEPREGDESVRHLLYEMWSGFIGLYDRLITGTEGAMDDLSPGPIEIRLNFHALKVDVHHVSVEPSGPIPEPEVIIHLDKRMAEVKFPRDFLVNFQQPENTGERQVLHAIVRGLIRLHQNTEGNIEDALLETILNQVVSDARIRVLHLFPTHDLIEHLLAKKNHKPIFLASEDFVFTKLRLLEGCTSVKPKAVLNTKDECNKFLHKVVEKVWGQLRDLLRQFDRTSVIRRTFVIHEAIIQDRDHWHRTAQAVIALHSTAENVIAVAQEREEDRSKTDLSARTILEMAICECPTSGGRRLSQWDLDELLAKAMLLIEVATDSDAIKLDIVEPTIQLHANGEYTLDRSFHQTVIRPFFTNYFQEEFEGAAGNYSKLYHRERPVTRTRANEIYSPEYINAFHAEYGITLDEAVDGFSELMELALECESIVVETKVGLIRERFSKKSGLSSDACQAFLNTFGLLHRTEWDVPPPGFDEKEIYPWRYRRRFSAMIRPLLVYGEEDDSAVLYGVGALRLGFGYLLHRTERGQFPETFFVSQEMKSYLGAAKNKRGHAFEATVADLYRKNGWQARKVLMTELGSPSSLGDIDVLAWKQTGEVLIVECKNLLLARTVAEIVEVCRRFRGEAMDDLAKHVNRVEWVRENPSSLERIVGFRPDCDRIDDRLVTNTHVPMKYLTSLPIRADKIGPFN